MGGAATYTLKFFATDTQRNNVSAYAVFHATHTARPPLGPPLRNGEQRPPQHTGERQRNPANFSKADTASAIYGRKNPEFVGIPLYP